MIAHTPGLMIILDGLGDRPCPQLDGQTPLEAANTPQLDSLFLFYKVPSKLYSFPFYHLYKALLI